MQIALVGVRAILFKAVGRDAFAENRGPQQTLGTPAPFDPFHTFASQRPRDWRAAGDEHLNWSRDWYSVSRHERRPRRFRWHENIQRYLRSASFSTGKPPRGTAARGANNRRPMIGYCVH